MRKGHCPHKMILKFAFNSGFNLFYLAHCLLNLGAGITVQQRHPCTCAGRIASGDYILQPAIWHHAQHHCIFRVNMGAERACQRYLVNGRDAHLVHQQFEACMQRCFGQLDSADIVLHNGDCLAKLIAESAAIRAYSVCCCGQRTVNYAIFINNTCQIHLSQRLDNTRAANAGNACIRNSLIKARLV